MIDSTQDGTLAWKKELIKAPDMARAMLAMKAPELEQFVFCMHLCVHFCVHLGV